jgi:pyridoxine 5-phosphate synthase
MSRLRLGVNIDHVATLRNARGGSHPDPLRAARLVAAAGGDGITAHLREDRRHITDDDVAGLRTLIDLPLNLEIAATDEMLAIALRTRPHAVCLVPERRTERTTEAGLDVIGQRAALEPVVAALAEAGIRVSLFVDAEPTHVEVAADIGAAVVELHTGTYALATGEQRLRELRRLEVAAERCAEVGLECHAGHGLDYDNVGEVARLPQVVELNIGHFLIGEAVFVGFEASVRRMRLLIDEARR